jgi:lambda family phage minor tail protein L
MIGLTQESLSLSPTAIVELYILDTTKYAGGSLLRFHAGLNEVYQPIVWQGNTYLPLPIEAEGFDVSAKGVLPRPKIRVANVDGLFSAEVRTNNDLVGCTVTRKRTHAKYLDAINFAGGNPHADENQHYSDSLWIVEQKTSENKYIIEWELASAFDVQGVKLPFRQVVQNSCTWEYKGSECGYAGTNYFDKNDVVCSIGDDYCSKRLKACRARHGASTLPYGAFPGAMRYAY